MTPNWTQRIGHGKYPTCVLPKTTNPKFSSASLYDQPFLRLCTFRIFTFLDPVLTKMSKCHKSRQATKKFITLYSLMTTLFIIKSGSVWMKLEEQKHYKIFAPMGFHVNENEQKNCKSLKIENFEKRNKLSGDMVYRVLPKKNWPGSTQQFPGNLSLWTSDDGCPRHNNIESSFFKKMTVWRYSRCMY